jgi:hypothetical protein
MYYVSVYNIYNVIMPSSNCFSLSFLLLLLLLLLLPEITILYYVEGRGVFEFSGVLGFEGIFAVRVLVLVCGLKGTAPYLTNRGNYHGFDITIWLYVLSYEPLTESVSNDCNTVRDGRRGGEWVWPRFCN